MNHYWNWAVQWLPMWLAPNLVTLLGLCFMVASAAVVIVASPNLTEPLPWGVAIFCAFSLFAYQTLDAIDGKQARRTGTSSPLGQLFDHGCDAMNTVLICTVLAGAWRLGDHPWLMLNTLFNIFFAFFMGQWEEYHTGLMMTNNGRDYLVDFIQLFCLNNGNLASRAYAGFVGITEGQVVQIMILFVTALGGAEAWDLTVLSLGNMRLTLKAVCMTWGSVLTFWVSACSVCRVLFSGHAR